MRLVSVERQGMPCITGCPPVEILAVLTEGNDGTVAAYVCAIPLGMETKEAIEWCAAHGRKIEYRHLTQYFHGVPVEKYRP